MGYKFNHHQIKLINGSLKYEHNHLDEIFLQTFFLNFQF